MNICSQELLWETKTPKQAYQQMNLAAYFHLKPTKKDPLEGVGWWGENWTFVWNIMLDAVRNWYVGSPSFNVHIINQAWTVVWPWTNQCPPFSHMTHYWPIRIEHFLGWPIRGRHRYQHTAALSHFDSVSLQPSAKEHAVSHCEICNSETIIKLEKKTDQQFSSATLHHWIIVKGKI